MLNINDDILLKLKKLGLSPDEAKVYVTLLQGSMSHLEISRKSGVNRTKVYRIADSLIKRGLITEETNDRGRELAANDPSNLEIVITTLEEKVNKQRDILQSTLPILHKLYSSDQNNADDFVINTYEGVDGFKQMLWNELKTQKEILIFGDGCMEDLTDSPRWSERHRQKTVEAGYIVKEIMNPNNKAKPFTSNKEFISKVYQRKIISAKILPLGHQLCVYNNTVSIYNWHSNKRVGVEIINKSFADMQRAIFENYWKIATIE